MASYTDDPKISFRPYVKQLPTEAEVAVGTYKQKQYDEGYQRIQSQIDKIAGLSIMRDVDKQYFQSKMNQLGANLRMVSMGDLSNYQLVNSIGGMVNNVGKDKYIQAAVTSTARVREEQDKMEAAQKAGKSSVNREYDFNKSIDEYLKDPNVGSSFSGRYKEHIDVNKKVLDVIAKLHPNIKIQDIAYGFNPDGSINTNDILNAMHRQGIEGVDENQIRTAINAVLDENDYDELASAGRYHYKDYDQNSLLKIVDSNYQITRDLYKKNLEMVEKDLLSASNPSQIVQLNESKKYYENLLGDKNSKGKLEDNYTSMIKSVSTNPDAVKAELYVRNWLDQLANGFSYREVKDEVLTNPVRTDYWKLKDYEWDQIKERNLQEYRNRSLDLEERKFDYEQLKDATKKSKEGSGEWVPVGDATTRKLRSLENYREYNIDKPKADATDLLTKIAEKYRDNKVQLDNTGALLLIEKYKNGKYIPPNPDVRRYMDDYIKSTAILSNSEDFLNDRENAAAKKVLGGLTFTEKLKEQLGDINDLSVNIPGQGIVTFSSKEIYNFLTKEELSKVVSGGRSTIEVPFAELSPKEKLLYAAIKKRYDPYYFKASSDNKEVDDYISKVSSIVSQSKTDYTKVQSQLAEDLAKITGDYGTELKSVNFDNDADRKLFAGTLKNLVTKDIKSEAFSYDADGALSLLEDEAKDVSFTIMATGDNYRIGINKGGKLIEVPVPRSYIEKDPYLGGSYLRDSASHLIKLITENGSSNRFGVEKDYNHAHYQSRDMGHYDSKGRRTVNLPVVADLDAGSSPDRLFIVIKLKRKDGSIIRVNGQKPQNIQQCEQELQSLTDEDIITMFESEGYTNIEEELNQ